MILDVGCGNKPRGDINIDFVKQTVPNFIRADALNLPFRDNVFSHARSYHVIEHVGNPLKMISELKRVASAVEIITPSAFSMDLTKEHIYAWNEYTFRNLLLKAFSNASVDYTTTPRLIRGRLGKYLPFANMLMAKLGFRRELRGVAWTCKRGF